MSKQCTPLWREAHLEVKSVKNVSEHFWKLRCRKSARRCGAKHISKSKCTKHEGFGPPLEVLMWEKCTPLRREAHFEVKMFKTLGGSDNFWKLRCRLLRFTTLHYTTFHYAPLHYTTLHYTTLHYTTLPSTTLHYITLHYTPLHYKYYNYTPLHSTTLHYTPLHSTALNYTTLHYITLHYTPLHYITLHYTPQHYNYNYTPQIDR